MAINKQHLLLVSYLWDVHAQKFYRVSILSFIALTQFYHFHGLCWLFLVHILSSSKLDVPFQEKKMRHAPGRGDLPFHHIIPGRHLKDSYSLWSFVILSVAFLNLSFFSFCVQQDLIFLTQAHGLKQAKWPRTNFSLHSSCLSLLSGGTESACCHALNLKETNKALCLD